MTLPEKLRHLADVLESSVITQRDAEVMELMAGHMLRRVGYDAHEDEEADLLNEMLEG